MWCINNNKVINVADNSWKRLADNCSWVYKLMYTALQKCSPRPIQPPSHHPGRSNTPVYRVMSSILMCCLGNRFIHKTHTNTQLLPFYCIMTLVSSKHWIQQTILLLGTSLLRHSIRHCVSLSISQVEDYKHITMTTCRMKVTKIFWTKTSTCRDGTLKKQSNWQYFHTIPTSWAILPTMPCVCYLEGGGWQWGG